MSQAFDMDSSRLILIRHAHRDNTKRELDNGLSKQGQTQALAIRDSLRDALMSHKRGLQLLSSPKSRCLETLAPLSKLLSQDTVIDERLDEQHSFETPKNFQSRIKHFITETSSSPGGLIVACSHGDWIPEAIKLLCGVDADMGKSGWAILQNKDGRWEILEFRYEAHLPQIQSK